MDQIVLQIDTFIRMEESREKKLLIPANAHVLIDQARSGDTEALRKLFEVKPLEPELDQESTPRICLTSQNFLEETLLIKKDLDEAALGILSPIVGQLDDALRFTSRTPLQLAHS